MRDEDALLRSINDEPDDDLPRLIYADWLEDHGDPDRAEFIRVQCRLDALSPLDPDRLPLEIREAELLFAHGAKWRKQAQESIPLDVLGFKRGFPVAVVEAENVEALQSLPADVPLGGLCVSIPVEDESWLGTGRALLRAVGIGDRSAAFWASPAMSRIAWLRVRSIRDGSVIQALSRSAALARLRALELHSSITLPLGLGDEGLEELARRAPFAGLRRLAIWDRAAGRLGAEALAASPWLAGLEHLRLRLPQAGFHAAAAVARSPQLQRLTSLDVLSENWTARVHCPLVTVVERLAGLRHVRYTGPVLETYLRALADSPDLRRFTTLELHNAANAEAALTLAASPHLGNLRALALSASWIGPDGAEALARSPHLTGLEWLDLSGNPITDAGARELANGPSLANLTHLDLEATGITDEGVRALARSPNLTNLRSLILSSCGLTDDAARALAASPSLTNLRVLQLWPNHRMSDASLAVVAKSPNLPHLIPALTALDQDAAFGTVADPV